MYEFSDSFVQTLRSSLFDCLLQESLKYSYSFEQGAMCPCNTFQYIAFFKIIFFFYLLPSYCVCRKTISSWL